MKPPKPDSDKFDKVYKELLDRATEERKRRAIPPAPPEDEMVRQLARIAAQTQNQRAAGALRRTRAQVTHWDEESKKENWAERKAEKSDKKADKELLDAYDAEGT